MKRFDSDRIVAFGKRWFLLGAAVALVTVFSACTTTVSVQARGTDEAILAFETGFSRAAEQTLKSLMGAVSGTHAADDAPLLSKADIIAMLQGAGLRNIVADLPSATAVVASGHAPAVSSGTLASVGILTRTKNSLTLTLGAAQFQALYAMLDQESQAYFDVMMIPALNDETMTPAEYNDMLASVFGQTFANEITDGTFSLTLSSPDGKRNTTATLSLGELLTLSAEKRWTVSW